MIGDTLFTKYFSRRFLLFPWSEGSKIVKIFNYTFHKLLQSNLWKTVLDMSDFTYDFFCKDILKLYGREDYRFNQTVWAVKETENRKFKNEFRLPFQL